jgi:tRNA dimethylallyltransferase
LGGQCTCKFTRLINPTILASSIAHLASDKTVTVLAGPTGIGKTDLSLELAQRWGVPIISADSRQCYRELAIGSAPPSPEQLAAVQHFFIADRSVHEPLDANSYATEARLRLEESMLTHGRALVVGGSGLYIKALLQGFDALPSADEHLRQQLTERLAQEGLAALVAELITLDPAAEQHVALQNPRRVLRAIEVCLSSGKPYTSHLGQGAAPLLYKTDFYCLDMPRQDLYARINQRVDAMMAAGLEAEATALYPDRHLPALQTVGYRELFDYLDGNTSLDAAIDLIKQNTRRYAKRQGTWFRAQPGVQLVGHEYIRTVAS